MLYKITCTLLALTPLIAQQQGSKSIVPMTVSRRVALIIGNSGYRYIPRIDPATADAEDMAASLRRLGFDTVEVQNNLTGKQLIQTIGRFTRTQVAEGDLALVYYSGHGGMLGEENYLLPVDYEPPSDEDLVEAQGGFRMSKLRDMIEARGARVRVLIFDACRNSPVIASKQTTTGLAEMASRKPEGTFIAFASAHNQVSRFQIGDRNSFYTAELLKALAKPDRDLEELFKQVRVKVYENTGGKQTPYLYGFLSKPLYLGKVPEITAVVPDPGEAAEVAFWNSIKDSKDAGDYRAYLHKYPTGRFAELAEARVGRFTVVLPKAGDSKRNPKDGQVYKYIPAGMFRMGCSADDSECFDNEKPARDVTLTSGFWLGQTEVTVEAYRNYTKTTGMKMPPEPTWRGRKLNAGWRDGKMPIVNVTWDESKGYCDWIGGRLPTEAEWEYAARGGTSGARYGALTEIAWYGDNSGKSALDTTKIWTQQPKKYDDRLHENENSFQGVGLKSPNAPGLYDMLGNVSEWVNDWYGEEYYGKAETTDPQGPPNGKNRSLRGGSWFNVPWVARVSNRDADEPSGRYDGVGFRCMWEASPLSSFIPTSSP